MKIIDDLKHDIHELVDLTVNEQMSNTLDGKADDAWNRITGHLNKIKLLLEARGAFNFMIIRVTFIWIVGWFYIALYL